MPPNKGLELTGKSDTPFAKRRAKGAPLLPAAHPGRKAPQNPIRPHMSDPFVFISYSRQDRHFVDRLSRELQLAGVRTWTDTQNIAPGADFRTAISKSLQDAKVLIYVSSAHSAGSEWMQHELRAFSDRPGTQVLPLVLDEAGRHSMPESLRTIQWLDFTGDFDQPLSYLLKALHSLRGNSPRRVTRAKVQGVLFSSATQAKIQTLSVH